jgi:hypothetical protein
MSSDSGNHRRATSATSPRNRQQRMTLKLNVDDGPAPKLQHKSGQPAPDRARPTLRTPASRDIPRNLQMDETVKDVREGVS